MHGYWFKYMLTLASGFTLAAAVNMASLLLLILRRLPFWAFRWTNKGLLVTSPVTFAVSGH